MAFRPEEAVREEIERTDGILREVGVKGDIDFRTPMLLFVKPVPQIIEAAGRRHITVTLDSRDWTTQEAGLISGRVIDRVAPGDIVLLHDGKDGIPGADRSGTVEATEVILETLTGDGYRFVTVEELFPLPPSPGPS